MMIRDWSQIRLKSAAIKKKKKKIQMFQRPHFIQITLTLTHLLLDISSPTKQTKQGFWKASTSWHLENKNLRYKLGNNKPQIKVSRFPLGKTHSSITLIYQCRIEKKSFSCTSWQCIMSNNQECLGTWIHCLLLLIIDGGLNLPAQE